MFLLHSEREPKGSEAVFTFSCFLVDLCLGMICLHLFLQCMSVGDTAGKLHGERPPAGMYSPCVWWDVAVF